MPWEGVTYISPIASRTRTSHVRRRRRTASKQHGNYATGVADSIAWTYDDDGFGPCMDQQQGVRRPMPMCRPVEALLLYAKAGKPFDEMPLPKCYVRSLNNLRFCTALKEQRLGHCYWGPDDIISPCFLGMEVEDFVRTVRLSPERNLWALQLARCLYIYNMGML